jgi:hypothetical protein
MAQHGSPAAGPRVGPTPTVGVDDYDVLVHLPRISTAFGDWLSDSRGHTDDVDLSVSVDEFEVADPPEAWMRAGFSVGSDSVCRIGGVGIRLVGRDRGAGIVGWSLRGLPSDICVTDVDGVPTTRSGEVAELSVAPSEHPNGVIAIDHVVLFSPDLGRTVESLAAVAAHPRRERDTELGGQPMRQIFFRLGEVIVEVIGSPTAAGEGPSSLWGLTYVVADIGATASFFGDRTAPVKDAVQPGRRISTLRHQEFGMSVRTALISAPVRNG